MVTQDELTKTSRRTNTKAEDSGRRERLKREMQSRSGVNTHW